MRNFVRGLMLFAVCITAAKAEDLGRVALVQALKNAAHPFTLMCVAAHPDDEDGATLAYYRMKYGVSTVAVIATRGEGGQNEIGPELNADLGVIRMREMANAAKVEGSTLRFLNLPEFGFSKSPEETFEKWDHAVALQRMVAAIEDYRPQVIITNHGLMKDHGHHQAIGQIVLEAVQQIHREHPDWSTAQRLYVRKFEGGADTVAIDLGELEPLRGVTYAQVAAQALGEHKSQGMKLFIDRYLTGHPQAHYMLRAENHAQPPWLTPFNATDLGPLFDGVRTIRGDAGIADLSRRADEGLSNEGILAGLAELAKTLDAPAFPYLGLDEAAATAAELRVKLKASDLTLVRGQALSLAVELSDFGNADISTAKVSFGGEIEGLAIQMQDVTFENGVALTRFEFTVPEKTRLNIPNAAYFAEGRISGPRLSVLVEGKTSSGAPFARRERIFPDVAPAAVASFEGGPYLLYKQGEAEVRVKVTHYAPGAGNAIVKFEAPEGWQVSPATLDVDFKAEDEERTLAVKLKAKKAFSGRETLRAVVGDAEQTAETAVVAATVRLPKKAKVGLIHSYDDTLEATLKKLGVPYGLLGAADFSAAALAQYSSVVVDMRAYAYRPDLVANNETLLDYARDGGTVIVLYHKTFDWKPEFAPFKLEVANNRVTREDAAMTLLAPRHPIFTQPNVIGAADWEGWIQERGLYFAGAWGPEFTPLLACNDPGEDLPPGALLAADCGNGKYVYCALALYRQLRDLNPGALRLFANLIAY